MCEQYLDNTLTVKDVQPTYCLCCGVGLHCLNSYDYNTFCDDCDSMLEHVWNHHKDFNCSIYDSVNAVMKDHPEDQKEFAAEWWSS